MKQIVVVVHFAGLISALPPLISLLSVLKDIGVKCVFLGLEHLSSNAELCAKLGVEYCAVRYKEQSISFVRHPIRRLIYELLKRRKFLAFRAELWRVINSFRSESRELLVWTVDYASAANLGDQACGLGRRHIQTFYELEKDRNRDAVGFHQEALHRNATIVECEPNRAEIFAANHDMEYVPFVIPNCPYDHPRSRNLPVESDAAKAVIESWKGKFVFLYQGVLSLDRSGILDVLELLCKSFPEDVVAVMTWQDDLNLEPLKKYKNFCRVPYVPAPKHLQVTSHASVGLAFYSRSARSGYSKLNAVYCAPNKIYEYAGFGVPILCNDVPGLKYTVEAYGAGACWSQRNFQRDVVAAANRIKSKYEEVSCGSTRLFDSVDLKQRVSEIVDFALNRVSRQ